MNESNSPGNYFWLRPLLVLWVNHFLFVVWMRARRLYCIRDIEKSCVIWPACELIAGQIILPGCLVCRLTAWSVDLLIQMEYVIQFHCSTTCRQTPPVPTRARWLGTRVIQGTPLPIQALHPSLATVTSGVHTTCNAKVTWSDLTFRIQPWYGISG